MDSFEIQSRLKFISNVQIGDKINVKFMLIQKDCFSTKLSRTLYYENRITTLNFVRDNINRALEIITKSCCQQDKELTSNLMIDLKKSKIGIENLRQTYINDIKFCCDLNTILQTIDIKITECEKLLGYNLFFKHREISHKESIPRENNHQENSHKENSPRENSHQENSHMENSPRENSPREISPREISMKEISSKEIKEIFIKEPKISEKYHHEKDIDLEEDFHTPKTPHLIHSK